MQQRHAALERDCEALQEEMAAQRMALDEEQVPSMMVMMVVVVVVASWCYFFLYTFKRVVLVMAAFDANKSSSTV